jgi:hypothetical protein
VTAPEAVAYEVTSTAAEPGAPEPWIEVTVKVRISGEWVTPQMIAYTARQFAVSLGGRLRAAGDEAPDQADPWTDQ